MLLQSILNEHRADLNKHRASYKHIQNKNDNLMILEPKLKDLKNQYEITERVKKNYI